MQSLPGHEPTIMQSLPGHEPTIVGIRYSFMCPAFPQYIAAPTPFIEPQQWRELPLAVRVLPDGREAYLFTPRLPR